MLWLIEAIFEGFEIVLDMSYLISCEAGSLYLWPWFLGRYPLVVNIDLRELVGQLGRVRLGKLERQQVHDHARTDEVSMYQHIRSALDFICFSDENISY